MATIHANGEDVVAGNLVAKRDQRPGTDEFLLGVGISMYQNSGCGGAATNWSDFGQKKGA